MKKILYIFAILICENLTANAQTNCIELKHKYYSTWFDTILKAPIMGYYVQTKEHALTKAIDRSGVYSEFKQDPLLPKKWQTVSDKAYSSWNRNNPNQIKDKGHICPFTAFDFDSIAAIESMYYSNTNPQSSFFNEHQWERVEQYVLKVVSPLWGDVQVWTGCIIPISCPKMGDAYIPLYYWKKIVYIKQGKQVNECWQGLNNEANRDTNPDSIKIPCDSLDYNVHKFHQIILPLH